MVAVPMDPKGTVMYWQLNKYPLHTTGPKPRPIKIEAEMATGAPGSLPLPSEMHQKKMRSIMPVSAYPGVTDAMKFLIISNYTFYRKD